MTNKIVGRDVFTRAAATRSRFLGCAGCVVAPHHRETCTLYLCAPALAAPSFDRARFERLLGLIQRVEWRLMELEERSKNTLDTPGTE